MKNRITAFLSLLFMVFTIGAVVSMLYITFTTSELKRIITLHNVEILRQDLIIKIKDVEKDLLTVNTELGSGLDRIVLNVTDLEKAVNNCKSCHHSALITERLDNVGQLVDQFETSLSYYITASANESRIMELKKDSYRIASELLTMVSEMAFIASQRLQDRTQKAVDDVGNAQRILIATLFIAFLLGLWIAVTLTQSIVRPIRELTDASHKIASGSFGYTTEYKDATEFGELASSFNEMSLSLKAGNDRLVQHMNRLAGLYRVTLPFHSVANVSEIFREVSFGVADLLDVEFCGLLMLSEDGKPYEHKMPAYGMDDASAASVTLSREDALSLYFGNNRKPLIVNSPEDAEKHRLPDGIYGDRREEIRNMLLGWVRLKGELAGIIRLANRRDGDFAEESSRLIGIISNNVSVAIENTKLYNDLRAQMLELKETQEQLVQAAKLAAIGELASNVAHEINNPLTSIMGYAELIKEETDLDSIMNDVEIISRESLRAREIVQQLLEFARKKPLEVRDVRINSLVSEAVALCSVQIKDARIRIIENYSDIPPILGDPNQLKQVFLNILNNSVHAMSDLDADPAFLGRKREISINTGHAEGGVFIEISDTGLGIPEDVLPKIFEPFFTTKREKGTGLGLSITYKIIQSHKGKIDVKSEPGRGTKFTIWLPVHISEGVYAQNFG